MLSNGVESKIGTLGSKYEYFSEWKRLNEGEQGVVSLETMLRGICKRKLSSICWKTSSSMTIPTIILPKFWHEITSISA